jgi:prephenate dehydrogenase
MDRTMGKVTIIGLGLIGGSMALALKRAQPPNTEICGFDNSYEVMQRALKAKALDSIAPSIPEAVADANVVIVCTPIVTIRKVFREMAPHLQRSTVVTDTASTKSDVLRWADEELPKTVYFVGGHPMAGKEKQGLHNAEAELFEGKPYVIVPAVDAAQGAVNQVVALAQVVGGEPRFLDADEHDSYAAAVSHLPLLTSIALFDLAKESNAWPELAGMSGPGFRDLTRLASGEPEMSHDIFLTIRVNVLHWLNRYIGQLQKIADQIDDREDTESLFKSLTDTQIARDKFLEELPRHPDAMQYVDYPDSSETFMTMLTGTLIQNRGKELMGYLEQERQRDEETERIKRRRKDLDDLD